MRKPLIFAMILIALCVLFFVSTGGNTTVELFSLKRSMPSGLALAAFTGIGVVIGALLT